MKIVYQVASLREEEILVAGTYGSDYKPTEETRTTLNVIAEYDDEAIAISKLSELSESYYNKGLTILKVYKVEKT